MNKTKTLTKTFNIFLVFVIFLSSTNCGTTSKIKSADSTKKQGTRKSTVAFDISRYDRVVVNDFVDLASVAEKKPSKQVLKKEQMTKVVREFADMIAAEIKAKGNFLDVVRNGRVDDKTLIIGGQVTRYEEGNSILRIAIGLGAGSAYFDANVEFRDGSTQNLLGHVEVDKNSWALGGWLAGAQNPIEFMQGAARNIADNLYEMRKEAPPARALGSVTIPTTGNSTESVQQSTTVQPATTQTTTTYSAPAFDKDKPSMIPESQIPDYLRPK